MSDVCAPSLGGAPVGAILRELQAVLPQALAALHQADLLETALAAGAAGLDLAALIFPPLIYGEDLLKLIELVVVAQRRGLVRAAQPEDPAMARATGR